MLYIFEDVEAVIKMTIKGRSPNRRHVSRTQRVAIDRLFDITFLTHRFGSRMWTPRTKLADMLTKGRFTEWNRLLCVSNISLFSSQRCSAFNSQNCFEAVAKRQQEGDYDERVVARSKSVRNLVSGELCGAINDAIFDGIFKPGGYSDPKITR